MDPINPKPFKLYPPLRVRYHDPSSSFPFAFVFVLVLLFIACAIIIHMSLNEAIDFRHLTALQNQCYVLGELADLAYE